MDADDNAGYTDSPEDLSGTYTIRGQAHHIVVMPTTPGGGNTDTPVVQEEQHRPRKKKSHKRCSTYELAELAVPLIVSHDPDASAATCAPSTSKSDEGRVRRVTASKTQHDQENERDIGLSTTHREPIDTDDGPRSEPTDTDDGSRSEQGSIPPITYYFNTVGKLNFDATSRHGSPYVRISASASVEEVMILLSDYWRLPDPKLIISIVGGSESYEFAKTRISSLFKHGLMDLATTKGVWILTPGIETGVYEMIGSSVKEHNQTTGSAAMNETVLLGIASWGSVAGRDRLLKPDGCVKRHAIYPIHNIHAYEGTQVLAPNHSHFIFVDDGTRNQFGGEIKWRAAFEKFLTEHGLSKEDGINRFSYSDQSCDVLIKI